MPHLLLHPHSRSPRRRASVPVAAVALAAVALAAAGCTSASSTPAASVAADAVSIAGAGSTFDAPFFTAAFAAYQQAHLGVAVSYAAVGSSAGITRFAAGQTNFGATDVPASPADLAAASGATVQVPVDLGAVAVAYNAITNGSGPLQLTGPVIARIFLGQITKWDDPAIQALNPGTQLPDAYINVVHRSDGSGTTYIFSNYLSDVSPAWASAVGTGRSLRWPAGYRRRRQRRRSRRHRPHPVLHRLHRALLRHRHRGRRVGRRPEPGRQLRPADHRRHHRRRRPQARHNPGQTSPSSTSPAPPATPSPATAGYCSPPASQARPQARPSPPSSAGSPTPGRPTPPTSATSPCPPPSSSSPPPPSPASPAPPDSRSPADDRRATTAIGGYPGPGSGTLARPFDPHVPAARTVPAL